MFCLFSYTFQLRTHFIDIFFCEGRDQIPTFCWFEVWRDRHEKRSLHSFRFDTGSAFSAPSPNCLLSIPTQLAFCQDRSQASSCTLRAEGVNSSLSPQRRGGAEVCDIMRGQAYPSICDGSKAARAAGRASVQVSCPPESIQRDINCSVDLRSTTAVGDRRYNPMRKHLCSSV